MFVRCGRRQGVCENNFARWRRSKVRWCPLVQVGVGGGEFLRETRAIVAPMAIGGTHPDYDATAQQWSRARDVLPGEDAVKAAGVKYLPRLDSQSDEKYVASGCCHNGLMKVVAQ